MQTARGFRLITLTCGLSALLSVAHAQNSATAQPPIRASKIILVGDSTVAVQSGWGSSFCAEHVTSTAACINLARGGRSSASYRIEGSWALAVAEARVPGYASTWILIQFGHNDQPGKPGRSTDLATEFPANLRRYVAEARAAGAQPVLVTPLTRRMFKDGKLRTDLEPWAAATRAVGAELKVPVLDLFADSVEAVQAMGPSAANTYAQKPPSKAVAEAAQRGTTIPASTEVNEPSAPGTETAQMAEFPGMAQAKLTFDYTHLGREGSDYFAAMITRELAREIPAMRGLLIL
ncbi:MAG TPA: rhamnogalacturonan acetylesterase [Steroidobacteraceae bacterium]|nr:rhamnogalacturonan acetylesterase [Steroidobacteraceae bacterium]